MIYKLIKGEHTAICRTELKRDAFLKLGFVPAKESKKQENKTADNKAARS